MSSGKKGSATRLPRGTVVHRVFRVGRNPVQPPLRNIELGNEEHMTQVNVTDRSGGLGTGAEEEKQDRLQDEQYFDLQLHLRFCQQVTEIESHPGSPIYIAYSDLLLPEKQIFSALGYGLRFVDPASEGISERTLKITGLL